MEEIRFLSKYLVLAAAIVGTILFKKYKHSKAKYFIFLIWFLVVCDFFGTKYYSWFQSPNYPVYNILTLVSMIFYLWWYYILISSVLKRKIILFFIFLFTTFFVIDTFVLESFFKGIQTFTYTSGVIFLIISICFYFIEVFKQDIILNINKSIYFWLSLGVLLFHGAFMPFQFASKFFLTGDSKIFSIVLFLLNVIMNTCFIIGFVKSDEKYNNHPL